MIIEHRDAIVIGGSIAQKPGYGGHSWALLQYALGLRELGWEVLFIDRISPDACVDHSGQRCQPADSTNALYLADVMEWFGLGDCFTLIVEGALEWIGVPREQALHTVRRSALLLNIMGFVRDDAILGAASRRVFLDIDPGFGQMWKALGLHDPFAGHDDFITIGERVGAPDCGIPPVDLPWITTAQPIALSWWPVTSAAARTFTTVASWRGANGPIDYAGKRFGLRVHEFRKFRRGGPGIRYRSRGSGDAFCLRPVGPAQAGHVSRRRQPSFRSRRPEAGCPPCGR